MRLFICMTFWHVYCLGIKPLLMCILACAVIQYVSLIVTELAGNIAALLNSLKPRIIKFVRQSIKSS
jgi:hypothetical protein